MITLTKAQVQHRINMLSNSLGDFEIEESYEFCAEIRDKIEYYETHY